MTTGALANPCGMEIGSFEHHVACGFVGSTTLSSKDTGNTHRLLSVANREVVLAKNVLITIERHKLGALGLGANHNLVALNHIGIKAMHRLAVSHHDVVGDVNNIVNRTQADNFQFILEPFGTFLHIAIGNAQANITLASLLVLDFNIDGKVFVVNRKRLAIRTMQRCVIAILHQPSIQVASHAPMRKGISTIGRDVNLNHPIALQIVIFGSRCSHHSVIGQHYDSVVAGSHANLVFGTNHSVRLDTTKLCLLDHKLLVSIIEHATQVGHNHLLSGSHIRRSAHNLLGLSLSQVNGGEMKVGVGNILASEHLAHEQAFQTAFNRLHFLQSVNLQTTRSQGICNLLRGEVEVDILFKPFIRNIH